MPTRQKLEQARTIRDALVERMHIFGHALIPRDIVDALIEGGLSKSTAYFLPYGRYQGTRADIDSVLAIPGKTKSGRIILIRVYQRTKFKWRLNWHDNDW